MRGEFSTVWNYEDYLAANWLNVRSRWLWQGAAKSLTGLVAIIFLINFSSGLIEGEVGPLRLFAELLTSLFVALASLFGIFLWLLWRVPNSCRKAFAQLRFDGLETQFQFDEHRFEVSNPLGKSTLEWKHICKCVENDRLVLLFRTQNSFFAIPKAQVDPVIVTNLKTCVDAAGIPAT